MIEYGIIAAMELEAAPLIAKMTSPVRREVGGIAFTQGVLCGHTAVVAVCGIGKVFAAMCAQTMILTFSPACILHTGVAGSLSDRLPICGLALADQVVQYDLDTSPLGDPPGMISGINRVYLSCDTALLARLQRAAATLSLPCTVGVIASGDRFVSDAATKQRIAEQFNAIACEMEGAAVGQVCTVNRVPFAVVRAISDDASGAAQMDYPTFAAKAAENAVALLCTVLEDKTDV